mmetsp:Transcript_36626/g.67133  ORF Transcript_36626/g.67133 Transcript_36626/m.67133 type:complete len:522 (+) Transcript_36626:67-1632(+)
MAARVGLRQQDVIEMGERSLGRAIPEEVKQQIEGLYRELNIETLPNLITPDWINRSARGGHKHFFELLECMAKGLVPEKPLLDVPPGALPPQVEEIFTKLDIRGVCVNIPEEARLNEYSILGKVDLAAKANLVDWAKSSLKLDRAMGSLCGMAIADATGHPFEFLDCQDTPGSTRFDRHTFKFYRESNAFGLKRGQWTDDASMGLCMADSLIVRRGFDGGDMRARFWCWWNTGYCNAFRKDPDRSNSVGLGGNISQGLMMMSRLKPGEKPAPAHSAKNEDAGNGSIMRLTPVPLFFHAVPVDELYRVARDSSLTTHAGPAAAEACAFQAHLIRRALERPDGPVDAKEFLETTSAEYMKTSGLESKSGWPYEHIKWLVTGKPPRKQERCWQWREESPGLIESMQARGSRYNGYPVSAGYFGSYALDGLGMALWAVYHSTSFDETIEKSVNLLGDSDSHGSVAGQIAGALYGYKSIDKRFLDYLNQWDDHECAVRAILLYELGLLHNACGAKTGEGSEMLTEV